jgi:hypothetical protein
MVPAVPPRPALLSFAAEAPHGRLIGAPACAERYQNLINF